MYSHKSEISDCVRLEWFLFVKISYLLWNVPWSVNELWPSNTVWGNSAAKLYCSLVMVVAIRLLNTINGIVLINSTQCNLLLNLHVVNYHLFNINVVYHSYFQSQMFIQPCFSIQSLQTIYWQTYSVEKLTIRFWINGIMKKNINNL